ncbi:MAG: glycosyltransferase family 9 protein [Siphonobacter aquaeclarae]|nr:glycosyltransferase family 9 protein [Siphonobacter aquaeclarae]
MQKTIALWQHRYRKYSEIARTWLAWGKACASVRWHSIRTGKPAVGILLAEHLGDIVSCEPLARQVRALHPDALIYWIVRKPFRELVEYNPDVDRILEEPNVLFSILLLKRSPFRKIYNLHLSNRVYEPLKKRLVNPHADAQNLTIFNYLNDRRLAEVFADAAGLTRPDRSLAPHLHLPDRVRQQIDGLRLPQRFVVLHTYSNQPVKDWKTAYWNELAESLMRTYGPVVEVGLKAQVTSTSPSFIDLCGKLSILETAEVIRRASFFIGVDSGPAHLANAVGTYGFILIGRLGSFEDYNLYTGGYGDGSNGRLIRAASGQPASDLRYEQVWQPVDEYLIGRRMTEAMSRKPI